MVNSLHLIREARECIGTPYQHQGRLKGVGLDCLGLILHVAKATGTDVSKFNERPYGPVPNGKMLKDTLDSVLVRIWDCEKSSLSFLPYLKNSDLFLITWKRFPSHMGFAAVGPYGWNIIHSHADSRFVTEHRLDEDWQAKVVSVYRFKDVK